jgi:SNF family Na+-dependent transporter
MFFTLSLGFGALIAFSSYMPIHNQVMRDAYTVVFINCGTSLFAGIVVFSILGYRETVTGVPADKVCRVNLKQINQLKTEISKTETVE